jgi:integrase
MAQSSSSGEQDARSRRDRTRRGNGEGSITRRAGRKSKPWVGRVRLQDGRRPTIYGETKEEVRLAIQRLRAAEADGKPIVITAERLGDLFELWIQESVSKKRPKTVASYESEARRNLLPVLGTKRVREIRPAHVQAFVNRLEQRGLSPRTVRYNHAILRACWRWAWKMGLVADRDLVSQVEFDDRRKRANGITETARKRSIAVLSPAGAAALLHALVGHEMHALFAVAIALGLRPAEALGLRWRDLDLKNEHPRLAVNQTVQRVRNSPSSEKRKRSQVVFEDAAKTEWSCDDTPRFTARNRLPTAYLQAIQACDARHEINSSSCAVCADNRSRAYCARVVFGVNWAGQSYPRGWRGHGRRSHTRSCCDRVGQCSAWTYSTASATGNNTRKVLPAPGWLATDN